MSRLVTATLFLLSLAASALGATDVAYVTNALAGTVSAVDVRTGADLGTIPVGCDPRAIVANADGTRVYVANTCGGDFDARPGHVSVVDTATNSVVDDLVVPFGPIALAVDRRAERLYVACLNEVPFSDEDSSGTLHVIDLASGAPVDTLPLGLVPRDIALTRNGRHAFVSGVAGARDDEDDVQITFRGIVRVALDGTSDVFDGPEGPFAISPAGNTLYGVHQPDTALLVLDIRQGGVVEAMPPVGIAAQDVFLDRARRRVYVTSTGENPNQLPDAVVVIDTRTNAVLTTFDGGETPVGVVRMAHSNLLLVTNFYVGTLRVMRARTGELVRTIPVGSGAAAIAVVRRR